MRLLALAFLGPVWLMAADGPPPKTTDFVTFAGGRADVSFGSADRVQWDGVSTFVQVGVLACIPRPKAALPLKIVFSSRGYPAVSFFEIAPLLDAVPDGRADNDRREVDRERAAVDFLSAPRISAPDILRKFPQLQSGGVLRPVLTVAAPSSGTPHYVGYCVRVPVKKFGAGAAVIQAAAADAPAETILTLQLAGEKSWWETEGGKTLLAPFLSALGTLVGAAIGFRYFLRQQAVQHGEYVRQQSLQHEEYLRQKFHERKYENRVKLSAYFENTYPAVAKFREATARNIRQSLWDEQIDVIMEPNDLSELDRICREPGNTREQGLANVDQFLRRIFPEFYGGTFH